MSYLEGVNDVPINLVKDIDGQRKNCYPLTRDTDIMMTDADETGLATAKQRFDQVKQQIAQINIDITNVNRNLAILSEGADSSSLDSMKLHFINSEDIIMSEDPTGQYLSMTHANKVTGKNLEGTSGIVYLGDIIDIPKLSYDKNGHITGSDLAHVKLDPLHYATKTETGGIKVGDNLHIINGVLSPDLASESTPGIVSKLAHNISDPSSLAAATEKSVYDAITTTRLFATQEANRIYEEIMGGSTKETLDTIKEIGDAIDSLGTVSGGILETLSHKSDDTHVHNYAASNSVGGPARRVDVMEDTVNEIIITGINLVDPTELLRNPNLKMSGDTLIVPKIIANVSGDINGDVEGNAATASKLFSPITIDVTGAVTSTPVSLDGSVNVSIPINTIDGSKIVGEASIDTTGNARTATYLSKPFKLTVGNAERTVNGYDNISLSFEDMGVSPDTHRHDNASALADGFMSSGDKNRLDAMEDGANKYIHPSYTARDLGFYKVNIDSSGHVLSVSSVTKADITALGIPGSDTTYGNATESGSGIMTSAQVAKLNGIEDNANKYIHPSHTAATSGFYKLTVDSLGHVTATTAVTKSDITGLGIPGSDTTYNDATQSTHGLMSTADKIKLDGIAAQANKYTHPSYTAASSGLYKVTVDASGHVSATTAVTKADITNLGIPGSDTDTKVTQSAVTASDYTNWRPLIFGASNSGTEGFSPSTTTDGVYATNTLSVQPSTGTIRASKFKGDVTGNVSGSSGSCTGNAATASSAAKLSTARTITLSGSVTGSVSFDGDSNVTLTTTTNHSHNYAGSSSAGGAATSLAGFTNTTTSGTAIDNATQNGHVYVTGTSGIMNQSDGAAFVQAYSTSWVAQIYQDYRSGQIALRSKNNGTWQAWRRVLDSSNYSSYAPALYIQTTAPSAPTSGAVDWFKVIRTE